MYWGDYARDTGNLNNAGHGAYLMLIKHYWCTGKPLTDDDDELWRIACCDNKAGWLKIRAKIVSLFVSDNGSLRHKRVDREIAKTISISATKADAGKKGAEKRWQTNDTQIADAIDVPSVRHGKNYAQLQPQPSSPRKETSSLRSLERAAPMEMVAIWNRLCAPPCPSVEVITKTRRTKMLARLRGELHGDIGNWEAFCEQIRSNQFLTGGGAKGWVTDFDWVIDPTHMIQIQEGKFADRKPKPNSGSAASDLVEQYGLPIHMNVEDAFREEPTNGRKAASANGHALGYETGPPDGWWEDSADEATDRPVRHDAGR